MKTDRKNGRREPGCGAWRAMAAIILLAGTARAAGPNVYVVPTNAAAAAPYDTWARAATNIQTAVDYAGARKQSITTVVVSNGTYNITAAIAITNGITVRSFGNGVYGGPANASHTIVQRSSGETRIFSLTHPNAVLEGLTIQNGYGHGALYNGLGVNMTGGLVRDCIIQNQSYSHSVQGGGVYMTGGTVSNCIVRGTLLGNASMGGGIFASGSSQVLNSQVLENGVGSSGDFNGLGGGIYVDGDNVVVRNCLIARNYTGNGGRDGSFNQGAGVYLNGGLVENCTIVANDIRYYAFGKGGGVYRNGNGTVRNCIIYFNRDVVEDVTDNWYSTDADPEPNYTCLTPTNSLPEGTTGNIAANPLFVNSDAGDYRLQVAPVRSPCINAGTNLDWMATAVNMDGKPRIMLGTVDMGAFEYWPVTPLIQNAGVTDITDKTATVRGDLTWLGSAEVTVLLFHGPSDGGTNRQAWTHETRLSGARGIGFHDITISHEAVGRTWLYRCCATNRHGVAWADSTGSFMLGAVEVKVTRRDSTEERPGAFVITRPAATTNGPLDVYFTVSGTGVNGVDYDKLDIPAIIPTGATEVRLPVIPNFNMGENRPKGVELSLAPGAYRIGVNNKASIVTKAQ